jgi:hypothetical protein
LKFLRHERRCEIMIFAQRGDDLHHRRHIVHERNIHRFHHRPKRKATVGDDQRVRVPHPREQRKDLRIKNTVIDHARNLTVFGIVAKKFTIELFKLRI